MQKLQENGIGVNEQTAKAVMTAALGAEPSPEKKARFEEIHKLIDEVPKYGNDIPDVDYFARDVAYTYKTTSEIQKPERRTLSGRTLSGIRKCSPWRTDRCYTGWPLCTYTSCRWCFSVSRQGCEGPDSSSNFRIPSGSLYRINGTLFNQKFHPSALAGREGLEKFVALIRGYFDQKGMHMQFNVVDRETLLDAQKHPEKYKHLVVRVAGYSALFTTLSRSLQDDIIRRTEQGF